MNKFFSSSPVAQNNGIALVRIITGLLLVYHGIEVFDAAKMKEYAQWDMFKASSFMPYLGKASEFAGGVFLLLGLITRPACLLVMGTFLYITFFVGKGKFWLDDQHPFLFVLLALLFIFTGPGNFAFDNLFFKKQVRKIL